MTIQEFKRTVERSCKSCSKTEELWRTHERNELDQLARSLLEEAMVLDKHAASNEDDVLGLSRSTSRLQAEEGSCIGRQVGVRGLGHSVLARQLNVPTISQHTPVQLRYLFRPNILPTISCILLW